MNALWMRVVANIGNRKVTWRAVMSLGLPRAAAVGHLVMLWGGALEAETDGYVANIPDAQLESWACWDGERGAFARFIREHHVTDGRINDWDDYAGVLEAQRERERNKKATQRAGTKRGHAGGRPKDFPGDVPGDVPGKSRDKERKGKGRKKSIPVGAADRGDVAVPNDPEPSAPTGPTEPAAPPFANWPAAFGDAWKQARGGIAPGMHGRIGRVLESLVAEHGQAAVWDAWQRFLRGDKPQYGPEHFASNYAMFTAAAPASTGRVLTLSSTSPSDPLAPAALHARFVEFDLNRPIGDRPAYAAKVDTACPAEVDAEAWRVLVRRVHPWDLGSITFPPDAVAKITQRLAGGAGRTAAEAAA